MSLRCLEVGEGGFLFIPFNSASLVVFLTQLGLSIILQTAPVFFGSLVVLAMETLTADLMVDDV